MLQAVAKIAVTPSAENFEAATFEDFWLLYPKRVARKDALQAWNKLSAADQMETLVALLSWRRVWMSRGDDRYTPHAASWLNAERWTDELPPEFRQVAAHASHVLAKPHEAGERTVMPESVRAALSKLRAK